MKSKIFTLALVMLLLLSLIACGSKSTLPILNDPGSAQNSDAQLSSQMPPIITDSLEAALPTNTSPETMNPPVITDGLEAALPTNTPPETLDPLEITDDNGNELPLDPPPTLPSTIVFDPDAVIDFPDRFNVLVTGLHTNQRL